MQKNHLLVSFAASLFLTSVTGLAQTTISALPYTVTSPGVYVLGGSLISPSAGAAITIQASDVTLDLGDFYLFGSGPNTIGVVATDQLNITIKNGGLVGFNTAVLLQGSSAAGTNYGHHVENLNISECANGIWLVFGNQSIVARNQLSNGSATAILALGVGDRIENNDISGYRIGIRSFGGNYIQANFLNYCVTALWLGGDDRRKDNVVIRSANGKDKGDD